MKEDTIHLKVPSGRVYDCIKVGEWYFLSADKALEDLDPRSAIAKLPQMKGRNDDVLVAGCHRSGTNWTWEIVNMLIHQQAEYKRDRKTGTLIEFQSQDYFDKLKSPRVLSTHLKFHHIPEDMKKKKCKVIYIQRNPKDVAVSLRKYIESEMDIEIPWDDYLHMFTNADEDQFIFWIGTTKSWEKAIEDNPDYPILLVYYEKMKQNPVEEITRIGQFLGVSTDEELIRQIVDKTSFSNMKKAKLEFLSKDTKSKPELEDSLQRRQNYYRKGGVGDWKNYFTVAQNEYFDDIMAKRLNDSKLGFLYTI